MCTISEWENNQNIRTNAPALRAILFALMSVFSTNTFLLFPESFALRNFW